MGVRLTRAPLSYAAAFRELAAPGLGGVVLFAGRVRPDPRPTGRVRAIEYEVHRPLAERALAELERAARGRYPIDRVVLWHRFGPVPVDAPSVLVGVGARHRGPAFDAARFLIERLKVAAPIWKSELTRPGRPRRPRPGGPASR